MVVPVTPDEDNDAWEGCWTLVVTLFIFLAAIVIVGLIWRTINE